MTLIAVFGIPLFIAFTYTQTYERFIGDVRYSDKADFSCQDRQTSSSDVDQAQVRVPSKPNVARESSTWAE